MSLKGQKVNLKNETAYILGTSDSLKDTPWDRKDADYIACWPVVTQQVAFGHRLDYVFELHEEKTWQNYKANIVEFIEKNPNTVLFMQREYDEIKKSVKFPIDEIQDSIKSLYLKRYFTSSIAYMIAWAIWRGYKKIILHGIALSVEEEEYSMQRSCAEAWLAYGIAKGCEIQIAQFSALFNNNYMYGYEGNKDIIIKLTQTKEGVSIALKDLEARAKQAELDLVEQRGASKMIELLIRDIFRS